MKNKSILNFLIFSLIIVALALSTLGAITFQNIFPTTSPYITSDDTVNLSYGIYAPDGVSSITHSWNGTNTTLYDYQLVGFWGMNNFSELEESTNTSTGGMVRDISMYNNNGTIVGYNNTPGFIDQNISWHSNLGIDSTGAFNQSGKISYINISTSIFKNATQNLTISTWIYPRGFVGQIRGVVTITNQENNPLFNMQLDSASNQTFCVINDGTNTVQVGGTLTISPLNSWTHVICKAESNGTNFNNLSIYINGSLKYFNNSFNFALPSKEVNLVRIGVQKPANSRYFNGTIDNVMIWNKSLSQIEIDSLYNTHINKYNESYFKVNINNQINSLYGLNSFLCSNNNTNSIFCSSNTKIYQVSSIKSNYSTQISSINTHFYSVGTNPFIFEDNNYLIDKNNDGILESYANASFHKTALLNSGFNSLRIDMDLDSYYSNTTNVNGVNRTGNLSSFKDIVKYAYDNNYEIYFIIDYMPDWLGDNSTGGCNDLEYCIPNNYTKFSNIVIDFVNYTTENGFYNNVKLEFWNEPYGTNFFMNLIPFDSLNKVNNYSYFYNETYKSLKIAYPNIQFGGGGGQIYSPNFNYKFISSLNGSWDFITIHGYSSNKLTADLLINNDPYLALENLTSICTFYNANCSNIYLSEWGFSNINWKSNESNGQGNHYKANIGIAYLDILNKNPKNVSMDYYVWSSRYSYYNNPTNYSGYPSFFDAVSEAGLDNVGPTYYPPYNVTKNFAHLCPAGATVYVTSGDDDSIKQVSCKKGNMYSIIVINTGLFPRNITLNMSMNNGTVVFPYASLMNYEDDSDIYTISSGISQLGVLDSYEILYLVNDSQAPAIIVNSPTGNIVNEVNYWFNVTLDEEGSSCFYSLNGGTNVSMDQEGVLSKFSKLANIPNGFNIITFYCNDSYDNWGTTTAFITGLTPSGAGTGDTEEPETTTNEEIPATEQSLWDKINEMFEDIGDKVDEKISQITGKSTQNTENGGAVKDKSFMEQYIWLFIGIVLFIVLVFAGKRGR